MFVKRTARITGDGRGVGAGSAALAGNVTRMADERSAGKRIREEWFVFMWGRGETVSRIQKFVTRNRREVFEDWQRL